MLNYLELFGLFLELLYIRSPFFPENFFLVCLFFFTCFFLLFLNCWIDVFIFSEFLFLMFFFKDIFVSFFDRIATFRSGPGVL